MSMLDVRGLQVRYGAIRAVENVDLHVDAGEIVVLIGANGAGKSSVVNAIAGLVQPADGDIRLAGEDVRPLDAASRVRRGLALVIEGRGIFSEMTVRENIELGAFAKPGLRGASLHSAIDGVFAIFPRLGERSRQLAGTLSGGEQQMLAIGRALMSSPRLLVLDEPSLGLAPRIVDEIAERLVKLAHESGVTVLIAEQNAALGLNISDRAYVLQRGRVVLQGLASELQSDADLMRVYLES
jgi:branched-chain amino acid transport system ATP-binding protein